MLFGLWVLGLSILFLFVLFYILGPAAYVLLFSFAACYFLQPAFRWLEKYAFKRWMSVLLVLCLLLGVLTPLVFMALPALYWELRGLVMDFPHLAAQVIEKLNAFMRERNWSYRIEQTEVLTYLKDHSSQLTERLLGSAASVTTSVLKGGHRLLIFGVNLVLFPVFFFYMAGHYEEILKFLEDLIPNRYKGKFHYYTKSFDNVLSGFLRGQMGVCAFLGISYALGLYVLGVKYGVLIGLLGGALSIIPYLGALFCFVTSMVCAFVYGDGWSQPIGILIIFAVVQSLEGYVVTPNLVGNRVGLSPLVAILVIIAGANLAGILGMLIAIPFAGLLKIIALDLMRAYKTSNLFTKEASTSPP